MSGSGKTSIAKNLCEKYPDKYNVVHSYTDRGMREPNEWGHTFIDSKYMDLLLERSDIVAQTKIEQYRYCTIKNQFDENKINIYTLDVNGANDTITAFPQADIMSVLIRRNDIEADCVRTDRNVEVPSREDVDFLIDNNGTIEASAELLNVLASFDLFTKPSHIVQSLADKIDYIDKQYRFLDKIKNSLYEQLWYNNQSIYNKMCAYVEANVNDELGYNIQIHPDTYPEIFDGCLTFNVQGEYPKDVDLTWDEMNRLVERLSHYSHKFCRDNNCDAMLYRLAISQRWMGEDDYL